jgi:hypothetical protein
MATKTRPVLGVVWQNGTAVFLARVVGWDGVPLVAGDVDSVEYTVSLVDDDDDTEAVPVTGHEAEELTPADVLFNSLQTSDVRWTVDSTGYNFLHLLDTTTADAFSIAGRRYLVAYRITPTGEPPITLVFQVDCRVC